MTLLVDILQVTFETRLLEFVSRKIVTKKGISIDISTEDDLSYCYSTFLYFFCSMYLGIVIMQKASLIYCMITMQPLLGSHWCALVWAVTGCNSIQRLSENLSLVAL